MARFRYSPTKFWHSLVVALGLTVMVTGLTWMIFSRLGNPNSNTITGAAALIFLAFFSLRMALLYWRNDVVVAVLPTGIEDARWGRGMVEWQRIKEITLRQRENTFLLEIYLWPHGKASTNLTIDLEALEGDVDDIVNAVAAHVPVRQEF